MIHLPRLLFALWLAVALAVGQHAVDVHALGHASHDLEHQDFSPGPGECDNHSLFASIGSGLAVEAPVAPLVAGAHVAPPAEAIRSAELAHHHPFRSRAPPRSLA